MHIGECNNETAYGRSSTETRQRVRAGLTATPVMGPNVSPAALRALLLCLFCCCLSPLHHLHPSLDMSYLPALGSNHAQLPVELHIIIMEVLWSCSTQALLHRQCGAKSSLYEQDCVHDMQQSAAWTSYWGPHWAVADA